jgi:hypothetical protein
VLVRVNASHDRLKAGSVYELLDTPDLRQRAEQKLVTIITPGVWLAPEPAAEPDEEADGGAD